MSRSQIPLSPPDPFRNQRNTGTAPYNGATDILCPHCQVWVRFFLNQGDAPPKALHCVCNRSFAIDALSFFRAFEPSAEQLYHPPLERALRHLARDFTSRKWERLAYRRGRSSRRRQCVICQASEEYREHYSHECLVALVERHADRLEELVKRINARGR